MKDTTFLVESVKKLLRRGATTHLHNMLLKVRSADLAEAFKSLDEGERAAAFLPVLLKTAHIDSAVATSPFVTTSVDLLGLLAFFGLAGRHLVSG